MPRTRGAKNLKKPVDWYVNELKSIGVKVEVINDESDQKSNNKTDPVNDPPRADDNTKDITSGADLVIKKLDQKRLNIDSNKNDDQQYFTCGACGHSQYLKFSICPTCGILNTWR